MTNSQIFIQLASDKFQRADETPLSDGGLWSSTADFYQVGPPYIQTGFARLLSLAVTDSGDSRFSQSLWLGPQNFTNNQYSEFAYLVFDNLTYSGPVVRSQTTSRLSGYYLSIQNNNDGTAHCRILRQDDGGPTFPSATLATGDFAYNIGDVLRIAAVGSQISFYINGVLKLSAADSTYPTGQLGFQTFHYAAGTRQNNAISSWAGGLVASSGRREQISVALFNLLANDPGLSSLCKVITRTPRMWTQVQEAERPCLILFKGGPGTEHFDQPQNLRIGLTKYIIHYNLWLYITADPSGQTNAETIVNNISDALDAVLHSNAFGERQTLGGIVNNCWIDGGSEWGREFEDTNLVVFWRITCETGI